MWGAADVYKRQELGDKMAVVPVSRAGDILQGEVKLQQLCVGGVLGVLFQPVLQRGVYRPQCSGQGGGQLLQKHGAVPGVQRLRQGKIRGSFGGQKAHLDVYKRQPVRQAQ